jgi:hypothetical protein
MVETTDGDNGLETSQICVPCSPAQIPNFPRLSKWNEKSWQPVGGGGGLNVPTIFGLAGFEMLMMCVSIWPLLGSPPGLL